MSRLSGEQSDESVYEVIQGIEDIEDHHMGDGGGMGKIRNSRQDDHDCASGESVDEIDHEGGRGKRGLVQRLGDYHHTSANSRNDGLLTRNTHHSPRVHRTSSRCTLKSREGVAR